MKKRPNKKNKENNKKVWSGLFIVALFLIAVITGIQILINTGSSSGFYGIAVGVVVGFLVSTLSRNLK